MKHADTLPPMTGRLTITLLDKSGKIINHHTGKNRIVAGAYDLVTEALAGLPGARIMRVAAGTNGTPTTPADTAIINAQIVYIEDYKFPKPGKVQFVFRFGYTDAVGLKICEFGLLSTDNRLFSRITREPIEKTENTAIVGVWEINFIEND